MAERTHSVDLSMIHWDKTSTQALRIVRPTRARVDDSLKSVNDDLDKEP